jgi:hypothetical protein
MTAICFALPQFHVGDAEPSSARRLALTSASATKPFITKASTLPRGRSGRSSPANFCGGRQSTCTSRYRSEDPEKREQVRTLGRSETCEIGPRLAARVKKLSVGEAHLFEQLLEGQGGTAREVGPLQVQAAE